MDKIMRLCCQWCKYFKIFVPNNQFIWLKRGLTLICKSRFNICPEVFVMLRVLYFFWGFYPKHNDGNFCIEHLCVPLKMQVCVGVRPPGFTHSAEWVGSQRRGEGTLKVWGQWPHPVSLRGCGWEAVMRHSAPTECSQAAPAFWRCLPAQDPSSLHLSSLGKQMQGEKKMCLDTKQKIFWKQLLRIQDNYQDNFKL